MSASTRLGPVTAEWRKYRAGALPPSCAPTYLEAARMAFHAGVSWALAEVVPRLNPETVKAGTVAQIEAMLDDLQAFVEDER